TRFSRDWSSDVCSSDLFQRLTALLIRLARERGVNFAARSNDHAFSAERQGNVFANAVRADHVNGIFIGAGTEKGFPLVDIRRFRSEELRVGREERTLES